MAKPRNDSAPPTKMRQAAVQVGTLAENPWVVFTQKFILVLVAIIVAVDLFLALNDVEGDTISEVIKRWAYHRFFVLTWAWGVLGGHLFLTNAGPLISPPWNIWLLLGLTLVLLVVGLTYRGAVTVPFQLGCLVIGVAAGYLLWPQRPAGVPL